MTRAGALADRVAVVTGGSAGIGQAVAVQLAVEGALVVVVDRDERPWHGGASTLERIEASGGRAVLERLDLADPGAGDAAVAAAVATFGRLDVVVANAATSSGTGLLATTDDDWERVLAVNVTAPFRLFRASVRQLLTQEPRGEVRGRLVAVTSQHGSVAAPSDTAYGTSKAALAHLVRQVAVEHARDGVVCNAVAPGKVLVGADVRPVEPWRLAYSTQRTPWPRLGQPEDVAAAVLHLASDRARWTTGATLTVDGGWMAG